MQADGYVRRFRYLSKLELPPGSIESSSASEEQAVTAMPALNRAKPRTPQRSALLERKARALLWGKNAREIMGASLVP